MAQNMQPDDLREIQPPRSAMSHPVIYFPVALLGGGLLGALLGAVIGVIVLVILEGGISMFNVDAGAVLGVLIGSPIGVIAGLAYGLRRANR